MGISTGNLRATAAVFAFASVAAVPIGGCASGYHYSQVVGWRFFKTNLDTYPVSINQVDGLSYLGGTPVLVDPGERSIVVQGPPAFVPLEETRVFALDAKPCTRYYLVAVKSGRLSNDFDVRIDFEEPLAGCTPPPPK